MMARSSLAKAYAVLAIVVLAVHYVIPYALMRENVGVWLYAFWALLAAFWIAVSSAFVERAWRP